MMIFFHVSPPALAINICFVFAAVSSVFKTFFPSVLFSLLSAGPTHSLCSCQSLFLILSPCLFPPSDPASPSTVLSLCCGAPGAPLPPLWACLRDARRPPLPLSLRLPPLPACVSLAL
ncbi:hypothetical protein ATANTOWER_032016 [Ataeniobius toweri]|uniref:Uncharacterized protein n=1 Tax=Ataeniobius toweri TaxID=208326 RepID=A0ABU7AKB1_9TELE|nr:hypothetical protein [Ataeniobius toweri]